MPEMEVLISTTDEVQLGIIMNILENNEIAFIKRDTPIGGYMRIYSGASIYGTEILVNIENIHNARDLIANLLLNTKDEEE